MKTICSMLGWGTLLTLAGGAHAQCHLDYDCFLSAITQGPWEKIDRRVDPLVVPGVPGNRAGPISDGMETGPMPGGQSYSGQWRGEWEATDGRQRGEIALLVGPNGAMVGVLTNGSVSGRWSGQIVRGGRMRATYTYPSHAAYSRWCLPHR